MSGSQYGILGRSIDLDVVSQGTTVTYFMDLATGGKHVSSGRGGNSTYQYKWFVELFYEDSADNSKTKIVRGPGTGTGNKRIKSSLSWPFTWSHPGKHMLFVAVYSRRNSKKPVHTIMMKVEVVSLAAVMSAGMKKHKQALLPKPEEELVLVNKYYDALVAAENMPSETANALGIPKWTGKVREYRMKELRKHRSELENLRDMYNGPEWYLVHFRAVYLNQTASGDGKPTPLRVFFACHMPTKAFPKSKMAYPGAPTIKASDELYNVLGHIVDWTNLQDPRFDNVYKNFARMKLQGELNSSGDFQKLKEEGFTLYAVGVDGIRKTAKAVVKLWDKGNRYYPGAVEYAIPVENLIENGKFDTDGKDEFDDLEEFLGWIASGTGVLTLVLTPFMGGALMSALIWTSLFSDSAASLIRISQRHTYGGGRWQEDATDVVGILGNLFGVGGRIWKKGAKVLVRHPKLTKGVETFLFIGEATTDSINGILLIESHVKKYDEIMKDPSLTPEERADKLLRLFASTGASAAGTGMGYIKMKPRSKSFRKQKKEHEIPDSQIEKLGMEGEIVDTTLPVKMRGSTRKGTKNQKTTVGDTHTTTEGGEFTRNPDIPSGNPPNKRWKKAKDANDRGMLNKHHHAIDKQAKGSGEYIFVRDSNPDALPYIGKDGYEAKPMKLKAKTAKSGKNKGLAVADPKDPSLAEMLMNDTKYDHLPSHSEKYNQFVKDLKKDGFDIDPRDGFVVSRGGKKFYSDYDLHGIYNAKTGELMDAKRRMDDTNRRADQDVVRHTSHDEWVDRNDASVASTNYGPQPPVTVYLPKGKAGKAVRLETLEDMVDFARAQNPPLKFEQQYAKLDWDKWRKFQSGKGRN